MGKCRDCKFWYRGEKLHYSETSVLWDGRSHPLAGKRVIKREWGEGEGQCQATRNLIKGPLAVTHFKFGCHEYVWDRGAEKFDRIFLDYKGEQPLHEYTAEMGLQPEYEPPLGVIWHKTEPHGWVQYPKSAAEPIVLEPKIKPEPK